MLFALFTAYTYMRTSPVKKAQQQTTIQYHAIGTISKTSALEARSGFALNTENDVIWCQWKRKFKHPSHPSMSPDSIGSKTIHHPSNKTIYAKHPIIIANGTRVHIYGSIQPFAKPLSPGETDWSRTYMQMGIGKNAEIDSIQIILPPPWWIMPWNKAQVVLSRSTILFFAPQAQGFIQAFILGDRALLSADDKSIFLKSGLYHIIAISGQHVGILAFLMIVFLRCFGVPFKISVGMSALLLLFFMPLTQNPISVVRAVMSYLLLVATIIAEKKPHSIHHWAYAAVGCLLIYPAQILAPGFLLSFGCTLIILRTLGWIDSLLRHWNIKGWMKGLIGALFLSTLLFFATFPVISQSFHAVIPLSIFANLAGFILVPWILGGALFCYLLSPIPLLAHYAGQSTSFLTGLLFHWSAFCGNLPHAQMPVSPMPIYMSIAIILGIFLLPDLSKSPWARRYMILLLLVCGITSCTRGIIAAIDTSVKVAFLPVGHGDASLIQHHNEGILIDTGPPRAGNLVRNHLLSRGVTHLKLIVLSHWDLDHAGALPTILEYNTPDAVIVPSHAPQNPWSETMAKKLKEKNIPIIEMQCKQELLQSNFASIQVLSPCSGHTWKTTNQASLVLLGKFYGKSFLWTGDMDRQVELNLLNHLDHLPILTALKLAHHGSRTSNHPLWLKAWKPQTAIVSAAIPDPYRHPHPVVMQSLDDLKIPILHTSKNGELLWNCTKAECVAQTYR